jgi:hypothetical protein
MTALSVYPLLPDVRHYARFLLGHYNRFLLGDVAKEIFAGSDLPVDEPGW